MSLHPRQAYELEVFWSRADWAIVGSLCERLWLTADENGVEPLRRAWRLLPLRTGDLTLPFFTISALDLSPNGVVLQRMALPPPVLVGSRTVIVIALDKGVEQLVDSSIESGVYIKEVRPARKGEYYEPPAPAPAADTNDEMCGTEKDVRHRNKWMTDTGWISAEGYMPTGTPRDDEKDLVDGRDLPRFLHFPQAFEDK